MKGEDVRAMSDDQLADELLKLKKEQFNLRFQQATGQLDEEALFYLRSRGLSEKRARAVLLQAFARDILEKIEIEPLRVMLDEQIADRFTN